MDFLRGEKIFFGLVFFNRLVCTSTIPLVYLELSRNSLEAPTHPALIPPKFEQNWCLECSLPISHWCWDFKQVSILREILVRQAEILAFWDISEFEKSWDILKKSWDPGSVRYWREILECREILWWDTVGPWDTGSVRYWTVRYWDREILSFLEILAWDTDYAWDTGWDPAWDPVSKSWDIL